MPRKRDISEIFGKGAPYVKGQPPMSVEDIDKAIEQTVIENNPSPPPPSEDK